MTDQWQRRASLTVESDDTVIPSATRGEVLDLSDMRFRFQVRRTDLSAPNVADVRVYNLTQQTAEWLRSHVGALLTIQAGYESGPLGAVFRGQVIQVRRGRESPVDTYVDLLAADGDLAYTMGTVSLALAAGATTRDQLLALAAALEPYGVKFDPAQIPADLPDRPLPRAKVFHGMIPEALTWLAESTGFSWSIQGGWLTIIPHDGFLPGGAVALNSATGLIGLPEQTVDGVIARCLINPDIQVGRRVRIDEASIQQQRIDPTYGGDPKNAMSVTPLAADGIYRVYDIQVVGDTRGQEWYQVLTLFVPNQFTAAILKILP